jgi:hypothetical protein
MDTASRSGVFNSVMYGRAFLLAVALLAISFAAPAQYMNFLKSTPSAYFKGEDQALMKKNTREVLDAPEARARKEWSNPKTGSSGLAEVRSAFTATDGAPCKRLRIVNRAGGVENDATYAVCKFEGRGWLLHPDAVPADTAPKEPP